VPDVTESNADAAIPTDGSAKKNKGANKKSKKTSKPAAQPHVIGRVNAVTIGKTGASFSLKLKKGKTEKFTLDTLGEANKPSAIMLLSTAAATRAKIQVHLSSEIDGKRLVEHLELHGQ
jgi:hypothetical protein